MATENIVAVIGGSGLYEFEGLEGIERVRLSTPYGDPSDAIIRGRFEGREVLFLPRHGIGHRLLPTEVNSRANIWALKKLGASWCIAVSAVGSLRREISPGDFVVPDQLIDRTQRREGTFFGQGVVAHISFAEPFCPAARRVLCEVCLELEAAQGRKTHNGGVYVCMEGPAFSTRAESELHRAWGASLIGMTMLPEAKLAREAEMAYGALCFATDYDCWNEEHRDVDAASVFEVLRRAAANIKQVLPGVLRKLAAEEPSALAAKALESALVTDLKQAPPQALERLAPIIAPYLRRK